MIDLAKIKSGVKCKLVVFWDCYKSVLKGLQTE